MLAYELSCWSDLAKWLMSMQERHLPYKLHFSSSKGHLPDALVVTFEDVTVEWALSSALLLKIIPTLSTVTSPLKVFPAKDSPSIRVSYDPEARRFV